MNTTVHIRYSLVLVAWTGVRSVETSVPVSYPVILLEVFPLYMCQGQKIVYLSTYSNKYHHALKLMFCFGEVVGTIELTAREVSYETVDAR